MRRADWIRRAARFGGGVLVALALSGCFVADRPLLLTSDLAQPIASGQWLELSREKAEDAAAYTAAERLQKNCQTSGTETYCGRSVFSIMRQRDGGYSRRDVSQPANNYPLRLSDLGGGYYIVEGGEPGKLQVQYDIARYLPGSDGKGGVFAIYHPDCKGDTELHDLAPPRPKDPGYCVVPTRANLFQMMWRLKILVALGGAPAVFYIQQS